MLVRKPLALAFWGSCRHDRAHLTIGDISSVQAFYRGFHERGLPARILFEGDYPTSGVQTVDPASCDPGSFSAFVFVCGPLHANWSAGDFFGRFSCIPRLALNVSKVHESGGAENLFDLIIWRDSSDVRTFDVAIDPRGRRRSATKSPRRGLSVCLVTDQPEYGAAGATSQAALDLIDEAITISGRERVGDISTVLGTQSLAQIEDAFSSREMIVTTRLHGSLFAIRNGVPIVAIDQVKGGAKVGRIIGEELGWPFTRKLEDLNFRTVWRETYGKLYSCRPSDCFGIEGRERRWRPRRPTICATPLSLIWNPDDRRNLSYKDGVVRQQVIAQQPLQILRPIGAKCKMRLGRSPFR